MTVVCLAFILNVTAFAIIVVFDNNRVIGNLLSVSGLVIYFLRLRDSHQNVLFLYFIGFVLFFPREILVLHLGSKLYYARFSSGCSTL